MNTITVEAAGDQYQGDPAFTVDVDGVQVGGPYYVTTLYSSGTFQQFTLSGNFNITPTGQISINYVNDASGAGGDRNLYVGSVDVDGHSFQGAVAALGTDGELWNAGALWADGSLDFNMSEPTPNPTGRLSLLGVNLSGAEEYGALDPNAVLGVNYVYPTDAEIDYYASKGLNIIRLPFQWELLQPNEYGALSSTQLAQIDAVVAYANSKGMKVILDPHNYGAYDGNPIGSAATPISAFTNLWTQLAANFANNSQVLFGLMNEPNLSTATWLDAANSAIQAIRATGADTQKILVSGIDFDSTTNWLTSGNATVLGNGIVDPDNNYAFEVHEYLDSDGSGVGSDTVSTSIGVDRMQAITEWARDTGHQLFLGEFGANSDPTATAALSNMLTYMTANSDVWLGGTYWEASTSYNYYFNIAPTNGVDSPQMDVLDQFAPGTDAPQPPVLSGILAKSAVSDKTTVKPLAGVAVADAAQNASDSAVITMTNAAGAATDADGSLTGAGLVRTGTGTYALAATSPANLAAELGALVFTPTAHQVAPGATVATGLQLAVSDGTATATATLSVVATATATPPSVSGISASAALFDNKNVGPFIGVSVADPDKNAATSAAITLTNAGRATDADGVLTGAGLTHTGAGTYSLAAASPSALTSELQALLFTPTAHQVAVGSTVTTQVALAVSEGSAVTTANTSIITTAATPPVSNITVDLSEDAYNGDAQGYITIDGAQLGGLQTITASHALGDSDQLTFTGNFGTGPQNVSVQFTNDAYGGTSALDRNLYVDSIALNGQVAPNSAAPLYSDGTANFTLNPPGGATGAYAPLTNPSAITESVYPSHS